MKLVVGLGNPGREYAGTRHNAGAMCVRALADLLHVSLERKSRLAELASASHAGHAMVLAVPRTYVNTSGGAVSGLLQREGVKPKDLIVVYDDLAIPLGLIRVRASGSAGGHNGVKSVIAALGTEDFPRVRIGIGQPRTADFDQISFVLGRFSASEKRVFTVSLASACDAILCMVSEGVAEAMNRYNRRASAGESPDAPEG
jgi:PTH1 family peptidyl-tRNA hydrolase